MDNNAVSVTDLQDLKLYRRGKVRDVYDLGNELLIIATDRISCFDVVLPTPIPYKGIVLTQISKFWFDFTRDIARNHLITTEVSSKRPYLAKYDSVLARRSMLVRKSRPLAIECVVRGYLAGSGWKEYQRTGMLSGHKLPSGLKESQELPETIFTPSTKAQAGHDMNISEKDARVIVGDKIYQEARGASLSLYQNACLYAEKRGIIIADTKFEFGLIDGQLFLIDEILTPDSSRFWPQSSYWPGRSVDSFDKQFVRDYLEGLAWDKTPPAPALPAGIIKKTTEKYLEAYKRIVGKEL